MKFTTDNLKLEARGEYLIYVDPSGERQFVARFKYVRAGGDFAKFLRKNFTVEEFFYRRAAGQSPLTILEDKGYILPHIRKAAARGDKGAINYVTRRLQFNVVMS